MLTVTKAEETIQYNGEEKLHLDTISAIYLPETAVKEELNVAKVLQKKLQEHYQLDVSIKRTLSKDEDITSIILGRDAVLGKSIMTQRELESVKHDGYIIRVKNKQIGIAGYDVAGTLYGSYRFLREIGLRIYPRKGGPDIEVFTPLEKRSINIKTLIDKPFYKYRDVFSNREKGQFGTSMRKFSLGELHFAREQPVFKEGGYIGWDHTAGYLVPMQLYREEYPDYYGKIRGFRAPKDTRTLRVPLCTCNKDVQRISAERAKEWMAIQPEKKYFMISNGDSTADCPICETTDPIPDYYTDRELNWANYVAREIQEAHPDKTLFTLAYRKTVKPPVNVNLDGNVVVLYAPWYWNSRATSAVSLDHPINYIAEEEFQGWIDKFPGQVGIYDYPGAWVYGTAERIKYYAKHGVRWIYFNGPRGNMLHWVASQLLWDPALNTDKLIDDYTRAAYGKAANAMLEYWHLRKAVIDRNTPVNHRPLEAEEFSGAARKLLQEAISKSEDELVEVQTRILEASAEGIHVILRYAVANEENIKQLKQDLQSVISLNQHIYRNAKILNYTKGQMYQKQRLFNGQLKSLGIKLTKDESNELLEAKTDGQRVKQVFSERMEDDIKANSNYVANSEKKCQDIKFDDPGEVSKWKSSGPVKASFTNPASTSITNLLGERRQGIQVNAISTKLTKIHKGNISTHSGNIVLEHQFKKPINIEGCRYLDFNLHSDAAVPVTIQVNGGGGIKSDVNLLSGEQLIRIDLKNYKHWLFKSPTKMNVMRSIAFQIKPQDNFYPYPVVKDVQFTVLGLEAKNHDPLSENLPYREKVNWMTSYRANIPFDNDVKRERFRSFTRHRVLYPILKNAVLPDKKIQANGFFYLQ